MAILTSMAALALQGSEYEGGGAGGALAGGFFMVIWLVVTVVMIAALWKIFAKAGQPGWACIIPIYNIVVMLQIVKRPLWWIILMLIPFVNVVVGIIITIDLAKAFRQGTGFAIGLILLPFVFYPILGFGDARYQG